MKNSLSLKEIEIAVKDPEYLKHQNHKKLVSIANDIIEGKFGKFEKADDSDNFKFPYYEGLLKGKDMEMIFKHSDVLWFPQFYILSACLEKILPQTEVDAWQETDFDWTNEEYERENFTSVEFKKNFFETEFFLTSKDRNFTTIGQFKNNKIEVKIKEY